MTKSASRYDKSCPSVTKRYGRRSGKPEPINGYVLFRVLKSDYFVRQNVVLRPFPPKRNSPGEFDLSIQLLDRDMVRFQGDGRFTNTPVAKHPLFGNPYLTP